MDIHFVVILHIVQADQNRYVSFYWFRKKQNSFSFLILFIISTLYIDTTYNIQQNGKRRDSEPQTLN